MQKTTLPNKAQMKSPKNNKTKLPFNNNNSSNKSNTTFNINSMLNINSNFNNILDGLAKTIKKKFNIPIFGTFFT